MADLAQLETALRNADAAGDVEAARTLAGAITKARAQAAPQPAAQPVTKNNDMASQLGLTARYLTKGALALPAMGADAIGGTLNALQDAVLGQGGGYRFKPTLQAADDVMTKAGIPQPDTALQRIIGRASETMAGGGTGAALAGLAAKGAAGTTQAVLQRMAANPTTQLVSGATAGAAGQQSAENGGGWGSQFVSSLLGGMAGAGAVGAAQSAGKAVRNMITPATVPADLERTITVALQRQGIDPASITPALRASLMQDVQAAMKTGQGTLDPAALARLADYRRLGLTPTRGRVTLDPIDVTREQNAMRTAAATGARDAQLPGIAQGNNQRLLSMIDELKPINDPSGIGAAAMRPIAARDASLQQQVNALYSRARDQSGRSAQMDGAAFTQAANQALQKNLAPKLGAEVDQVLNDIATGKTPLTVEYAQQLKTMLGRKAEAARGTQGDLSYAYGLVRKALDEAPLRSAPQVNPGNLPAVPGTVPTSPAGLGQDAINAFNAARSAAKQRFDWQDSAPGIAKALNGATPDTFVQQNILSRGAGFNDVAKIAETIGSDPAAREAVRGSIVQYLKEAAIGKGNTTATGNFSGRGWASAVDGIGDKKLGLFFDPAEVEQLKAMGRVGTTETFQPRGSAVNNSNTAAGFAGLLQGLSNQLGPVLGKIPGGQALARPALDNLTLSFMEKGARNAPSGLLIPAQVARQPGGLLDPALIPLLTSSGLLPPVRP